MANRYKDHLKLRLYYLCYKTNTKWLDCVLRQCNGLESDDVEMRVAGCLSGKVATVVMLLGPRKQLCIFPERVTSSSINHLKEEWHTSGDLQDTQSVDESRTHSVGDVLGSVFDFDDGDDHSPIRTPHKTDSNHTKSTDNHNGRLNDNRVNDKAEQIQKKFENWMEKFADGTLKRYKLTSWPEWTSGN